MFVKQPNICIQYPSSHLPSGVLLWAPKRISCEDKLKRRGLITLDWRSRRDFDPIALKIIIGKEAGVLYIQWDTVGEVL